MAHDGFLTPSPVAGRSPRHTASSGSAPMDTFIIEGQAPLSGSITVEGNKNAALPLLAAILLTDDTVTLGNVPRIKDVHTMIAILEELGV